MASRRESELAKRLMSNMYKDREVCREVLGDIRALRNDILNQKILQMKSRCDDIQRVLEFNDLTFDTSKKNIDLVSKAVTELYELREETNKLKADWENFNKESRDRNNKFIDELIEQMVQLCNSTEPKGEKAKVAISSTLYYCKSLRATYSDQRVLIYELMDLQQKLHMAMFEDRM